MANESGGPARVDVPPLPSDFQRTLDEVVSRLRSNLGANLYSLILYGSAARGDLDPGRSDLNLLIVLEASTALAHQAIRQVASGAKRVEPFVVERRGLPRATRVFALKFFSIRRNYRVLHGADPLRGLELAPSLHVFLTEQELRNLRMRLVRAYILSGGRNEVYERFLSGHRTKFIVALSDALRCTGREIPRDLSERLPEFASTFQADVAVLSEMSKVRRGGRRFSAKEIDDLHGGLVELLGRVLSWMESQWPQLPL